MIGLSALVIAGLGWYLWERSHRATRQMPEGVQLDITLPHTEPWELYHNDFSLCSKKIRVCLSELEIDYRSHHIDLVETGAYQNISRDFLAVNPAGLVPVLVHNGHPIYESHAQVDYAAKHSERAARFTPVDPERNDLMRRWLHLSSLIGDDPVQAMDETAGNAIPGLTLPIFAAMIEDIPAFRIVEGLLFHRLKSRAVFFLLLKARGLAGLQGIAPAMTVLAQSRLAMHRHLAALETDLQQFGGPYLVGQQFTLADVGMMALFDRLREGDWLEEFLLPDRPLTAAYWQALQARNSYRCGVAEHAHPAVANATQRIAERKSTVAEFRAALLGAA